MRIFVKPNGNFYKSDDTPVSDYVDLSLRDGTLVLKDVEFPLTSIATKASVFRSRRRKDNFDKKQQKVIKEPDLCKFYFTNELRFQATYFDSFERNIPW